MEVFSGQTKGDENDQITPIITGKQACGKNAK